MLSLLASAVFLVKDTFSGVQFSDNNKTPHKLWLFRYSFTRFIHLCKRIVDPQQSSVVDSSK